MSIPNRNTWYTNVMHEEPTGYPSYHNKYKLKLTYPGIKNSSCSTSQVCGPCKNGPKSQFYPFKGCDVGVM